MKEIIGKGQLCGELSETAECSGAKTGFDRVVGGSQKTARNQGNYAG